MTRAPGVYDPWRQAPEPAPERERFPAEPVEAVEAPEWRVNLVGKHGGLFVRGRGTPERVMAAAMDSVAAACRSLRQQPALAQTLAAYGIFMESGPQRVPFGSSGERIFITQPASWPSDAALQEIIEALRKALSSPPIRKLVVVRGIKPYLT